MNAPIVVGLSDSPHSRAALDWALRRARHSGTPVLAVFVSDTDAAAGHPGAASLQAAHGEVVLARDAFGSASKAPDIAVTTALRRGRPVDQLTQDARGARMIVVGTHDDRDGTEPSTRHSPAVDLAALSTAPVAVIPTPQSGHHGGILVGIDGSPAARAAVLFAARDAVDLNEPLTVVHVWTPLQAWVPGFVPDQGFYDLLRLASLDMLALEIAAVQAEFPDLTVYSRSETGDPATVLTRLGKDALEIVVGATSRHGLQRLLLGSVAHDTLRGASRPVIVVPDPAVSA
ncbi:universal stress protein [Rathayibacter sp. VKM Ac-2760]|uniref:universal stress protein n=1 Tax=Rathayibacter sp. VKM Ac-2760 TaxID=2609253 RepID=UPI001318F58D|nr:universal stress protein [Rathayibacter sp. VKM Ac-2760]QHC60970.1 universal stress protein [Rathayibacter sp. VKM Ac-2760]